LFLPGVGNLSVVWKTLGNSAVAIFPAGVKPGQRRRQIEAWLAATDTIGAKGRLTPGEFPAPNIHSCLRAWVHAGFCRYSTAENCFFYTRRYTSTFLFAILKCQWYDPCYRYQRNYRRYHYHRECKKLKK